MNQDDQRYTLMAAAAAAAYAQKKARDEARRAVLLSQALSQNMSLDPKVQEELKRLLQEEKGGIGQENFDWQLGWTLAVIVFGGLFVLLFGGALLTTCSSRDSYTPSAATYITSTPEPTATATPEPAATPVEVRRAMPVRGPRYVSTYAEYEKLPRGTDVIWPNGQRWRKP
jgi:hypothetical protein